MNKIITKENFNKIVDDELFYDLKTGLFHLNELFNSYDTLNKGIDELIEKYEDMVKLFDGDSYIQTIPIEMLEDLEKLKGE